MHKQSDALLFSANANRERASYIHMTATVMALAHVFVCVRGSRVCVAFSFSHVGARTNSAMWLVAPICPSITFKL